MDAPTPICLYASKPCLAPRSTKENGTLHRLCEFHRAKANDAQRRWHARHVSGAATPIRARRSRKAHSADPTSTPLLRKRQREAAFDVVMGAPWAQPTPVVEAASCMPSSPIDDLWSDEELAMFDDFFDGFDELLIDSDPAVAPVASFPSDWWQELQSLHAAMP